MKLKHIFGIVLVTIVLTTALTISAGATETVMTGYCGGDNTKGYDSASKTYTNLEWTLYSDGELVIDGEGVMYNFDSYSSYGSYCYLPSWFDYRSQITSVTINSGVTSIGNYTFQGCGNITNVTIPGSVTKIGDMAFYGCSKMSDVYISDLAAWCGITFGNSANPLMYEGKLYIDGISATDIVIPDSVVKIEDYAFNSCSNITSVSIGSNVKSIGTGAFEYCSNLANVVIPDSVESIGRYAFYWCENLESVTIGSGLKQIGDSAFNRCKKISCFEFPGDAPAVGDSSFPSTAFVIYYHSGKTGWTSPLWNGYSSYCIEEKIDDYGELDENNRNGQNLYFTLNDAANTATVGDGSSDAGYKGSGYGSVVIPDTVAKSGKTYKVIGISKNAFNNNKFLKDLTLGDNVTSINEAAFVGCSNLAKFQVKEGNDYYSAVDGILYDKMQYTLYCYPAGKTVASYTVPASVKTIGKNALSGAFLKELTVPETVQTIYMQAINGCTALEKITLPFVGSNRSDIESFMYIFTGELPASLKHITITDEKLKNSDFEYCRYVESISLPDGNTEIPGYAFYHCNSLKSIKFGDVGGEKSVLTLPEGITSIGWDAFRNCYSFSEVNIPASVTSIADNPFYGCTGIARYSVDEGNTAYCNDKWGVLYSKDKSKLIAYPCSRIWPYYNVATETTTIGKYAFFTCPNLINLYIPSTVVAMNKSCIDNMQNTTLCLFENSAAATYAQNNSLMLWYLDNFTAQRIKIYALPEQPAQQLGKESFDGLYMTQIIGGKELQLDEYGLSYEAKSGIQTVTVTAEGFSANFDALFYEEDERLIDFGAFDSLPQGSVAYAGVYDEDGRMLGVQEVRLINGRIMMAMDDGMYIEMKKTTLFVLDGVSFAPVSIPVTIENNK